MWIDDQILRKCQANVALSVWNPDKTMVVLGSSNQLATEVCEDNCKNDGVEILRRYGGGGTVVLYSGCVVLSLGIWVKKHFHNDFYFQLLNQAIIQVLKMKTGSDIDFSQNGISDIVSNNRKFCGTSLFRSRNYLLYQASIICDLNLDIIDRYIKHPSKEPEYRAQRSHKDFLVGLSSLDPGLTVDSVSHAMSNQFTSEVERQLATDCCPVFSDQVPCLMARVNRAD